MKYFLACNLLPNYTILVATLCRAELQLDNLECINKLNKLTKNTEKKSTENECNEAHAQNVFVAKQMLQLLVVVVVAAVVVEKAEQTGRNTCAEYVTAKQLYPG